MSFFGNKDFGLEVALGNVTGYASINKFGEALDCDVNTLTDVWDGADGATSTDIWIPPTQARVHNLTSASANDTSAGTGMRTVEVYGLVDWDTAESSETVTMNGTSDVATSSSYVIIHRMVGKTFGSGGTNAGIITATAVTDATITAAIQAGQGQTLMTIYGIPSTQTINIVHIEASALKATGASTNIDGTILVKENADLATGGFVTKHRFKFSDTEFYDRMFGPPNKFTGPCIIKMQVSASANNTVVASTFDAYVVNN